MAIDTRTLYQYFRAEVYDDPEGSFDDNDRLWQDSDVFRYMTEAQRDFARETLCIPDSTTFVFNVQANEPYTDIDEDIIEIRNIYLLSNNRKIKVKTLEDMERGGYRDDYGLRRVNDWESHTGEPVALVTDYEFGQGRWYPIPINDDEAIVSVYRYPSEITNTGTQLEIPDRYRLGLLYKMKALAYLKQDADAFDLKQSLQNEQLWQEFLSRSRRDIKVKTRKPMTTRYGGI